MPQDYARRKPAANKRPQSASAASRRNAKGQPPSPRKWFFAGLLCGIFLSALAWLAAQQPELVNTMATITEPSAEKDRPPKPTFDFYTLLPEEQVHVDVTPTAAEQQRERTPIDQYLLQAGSFQQAGDAERRRAELILLGLEARVQKIEGSNGRWFRVYIGPFESRSRLEKARSLTAQQGIDTLLLKRPGEA